MRFPPPEVVASWPKPNYENPITRKPYLIPVDVFLISVATVMVCLRVYVRFFLTRCSGIEDWLIILALIPAIGLTVTISLGASRYGWNLHIWDYEPTPFNLIHERAISWASQMLYLWSSSLTKISILVFYRTIFQTKAMQLLTLGCIYFTTIYFVACFLTLFLECRPFSLYWHILLLPKDTGGYCIDEGYPLLTAGVVNVVIDLVILILPIRTVLTLKINWKQKIHILSIFLAGAIVVGSSAIRVVATWTTIRNTYDVTWHGYLVWYWVGIEVDVGLICASLPACKSLFKSWRRKIGSPRRSYNMFEQRRAHRRDVSELTVKSINTISFEGRYMMSQAHGSQEITADHHDHPGNWRGEKITVEHRDHPGNWRGDLARSVSSTYSSHSQDVRTPPRVWSGSWFEDDDDEDDLDSVGIPHRITPTWNGLEHNMF